MGEGRNRELATAMAAAAMNGAIRLAPLDGIVVTQLDLACHCITGIAHFLGTSYGKPEIAEEMQKSVVFLQGVKTRYMQSLKTKVMLAQPGDVPPAPKAG